MSSKGKNDSSEDMFAETRMSFGDHLEELRVHLWKAVIGFLVAVFFSFFIGKTVLQIIAKPVEAQLGKFYSDRVQKMEEELDKNDAALQKLNQPINMTLLFDGPELARQLAPPGQKEQAAAAAKGKQIEVDAQIKEPLRLVIKLHSALQAIGRRPALSTLSIQEAFMAYFKVCLACGFVLGSPWIFYQIWLFVAAGLYPHEKRIINVYLPISVFLFICGIVLCQVFVIPRAIEALLWFNEWVGLEPDLRFNEWLSFAIMMPLIFGFSFQTPLAMLFMERIGLMTIEGYKSHWRIAFFIILIVAAVITPTVDAITLALLVLPMFGLYWLGIVLCKLNPSRSGLGIDAPEPDDLVEV